MINAVPVNTDPSEDEWPELGTEMVPHGSNPFEFTDIQQAAMYNAMPETDALMGRWIEGNDIDVNNPIHQLAMIQARNSIDDLKAFMVLNGPTMLISYGVDTALQWTSPQLKAVLDAINTATKSAKATTTKDKLTIGVAAYLRETTGANQIVQKAVCAMVTPWAKPAMIWLLPPPLNWSVSTFWTLDKTGTMDALFCQGIMKIVCASGTALIKYGREKKYSEAWMTANDIMVKVICEVTSTVADTFAKEKIQPWAVAEAKKIKFSSKLVMCKKTPPPTTEAEVLACGVTTGYVTANAGDKALSAQNKDGASTAVAGTAQARKSGGDPSNSE